MPAPSGRTGPWCCTELKESILAPPGRAGSVAGTGGRPLGAKGTDFNELIETTKRAAAALRDAGVPFLLAGGLAAWARGGPASEHDVDLAVRAEDAEPAVEALAGAGMRIERPPEHWLLKAYDGDAMIDVIFEPEGNPVDDAMFERAEDLSVEAVTMRVMAADDILVTKLLALTEHSLDYEGLLELARPLREQIHWDDVRKRTEHSSFARAFFTMVEGLELVSPT